MLIIEKKELLDSIVPKALLVALTETSNHSIIQKLYGKNIIPIFHFPFRIGREARIELVDGEAVLQERHKLGGHKPNNDVYLLDNEKYLQISREHCSIINEGDTYILEDRGSACGSLVNQFELGGDDKSASSQLKDGDIITLGSKESKYKYKFIILDTISY